MRNTLTKEAESPKTVLLAGKTATGAHRITISRDNISFPTIEVKGITSTSADSKESKAPVIKL